MGRARDRGKEGRREGKGTEGRTIPALFPSTLCPDY